MIVGYYQGDKLLYAGCLSRLSYHAPRFFILAQPDKKGVAQMIVRCPFGKFDLHNYLRFNPHVFFHVFDSKRPEPFAQRVHRPRRTWKIAAVPEGVALRFISGKFNQLLGQVQDTAPFCRRYQLVRYLPYRRGRWWLIRDIKYFRQIKRRMKQRILFAEDEPISRTLISMFLRREGYEVNEAIDGAEALALINTFQFDLVISDFRMPRVDGIAVITRLRSHSPDTPFIIVTSYPNDAHDVSNMPKSLIIGKPILLDNLKSNIQRML